MPDPDDLEAVRARVRTAVDRWTGTDTLVLDKADVLALLAPTLTEEERRAYDEAQGFVSNVAGREMVGDSVGADEERSARLVAKLLNAIDRISGSTSTGGPTDERFPNGYPEDPVLGPYEDAAGGPSDG